MNDTIIDQDIFISLKDLLKDKMDMLIRKYIETSDQLMVDVESSIKSSDAEKLRISAHTIKSTSQQIGAISLAKLFLELEKSGKENKFDNTLETFEKAKVLYEQVKESLEANLQASH